MTNPTPLKTAPALESEEPIEHCSPGPDDPYVPFTETDTEQSVPARFEQQAARYPDRVAVDGRAGSLTYDALNRWANRVSGAILRFRAGMEGSTVGLLLRKEAPMLAALVGALKAGQIYVALDPAHPAERAAKMLRDAGANLILADNANCDAARRRGFDSARLLNVDRLDTDLPDGNPGLALGPDTLAYIVYTSGSTGEPKGVVQNHRNVLHNIKKHTNSLHLASEDRLSWLASVSTAQSMTDVYSALLNCATLCPFNLKAEGLARLAVWLREKDVSIYHSSASIFRLLLGAMDREVGYPRLRVVKLGSEQVFKQDVDRWKDRFASNCIFVNALSSTEAGTLRQILVDKHTEIRQSVVPVGFAVDGMEVLLLDESRRPVECGAVGEIAIRSRYLVPGYWQRPELTRAKFLSDSERQDVRTFLTGDLGRMLPGGCLEYFGRKDQQVKIHGFRVEIGEVEAALLETRQLKQAAVVARAKPSGATHLAAYVVPRPGSNPTLQSIRNALKGRLPEHMVPSEFGLVKELPLTPSGKIDRQSLASIICVPLNNDTAYAKPFSPLESQIAGIWEELLNVRPIGGQHDFFELGGDSLLAVQMMDAVETCLGTRLPLAALYPRATVEAVAEGLLNSHRAEFCSPLVTLQKGGSRRPFFFLHGDFKGGGFYCRKLASCLGEDLPFYSILPHGLDGGPIPRSIEAMASDRLRLLLDHQPAGPYVLGGYCNGGIVAFEMARQMLSRGLEVQLLVLIDASALNVRHRRLRNSILKAGSALGVGRERLVDGFSLARRLMDLWPEFTPQGIAALARFLRVRLSEPFHWERPNGGPHRDGSIFSHASLQRRNHAYRRVVRGYMPEPYNGRVILMRTDDMQARAADDPTLGWEEVAPHVEVCPIPGDHHSCLTGQHLEHLGRRLAGYLRDVC